MPKLHGLGFADIEIKNRFKLEAALYDKIDKIIDWSRIKKLLKKYKRNKNAVGNPSYPYKCSRYYC